MPLGRKPARVELVGANLENVVLPYADLTGADFINADLTGAELDGAKVDGAKVEGARGLPNQSH